MKTNSPVGGMSVKLAVISLFLLLLGANTSKAVPACPGGVKVKQPDGTEITVYLRGDEYAHWNESEDGFLITKSKKSGEWVYMTEDAGVAVVSKHAVGKVDARTIGALRPNKEELSARAALNKSRRLVVEDEPSFILQTGTMYNLVVLVNFSDLTVAYPQQDYNDLFNQIGYSADGAAGSVKDYYLEVSYDNLTVQSTVVEAVTLDYGYAYYGGNDIYGYDIRPREMVQQALAKLEARGFDFSTVDGDSDGWIDGLTIIHAGGGEEYADNDPDYIWSHQWALSSAVTYDGVSMQMYHTEPARRGWDDYPSTQGITRIGVVCHENGHFLDLPDLYDYDYDSEGAGNFCLMAGGSWNGNYGTTPAHMSAWCKSSLGWVSPTLISSGGVYSLGQVETNAEVYKLQGSFPSTQYFLVENRQGVGFDSGLPGSTRGVLIWHIDETQPDNDDQTHYMVDLEEASGPQHLEDNINAGEDSDYFRSGNATTFTESSTPSNLSYTGQILGLNIIDVGASGASMSITVGQLGVSSITPNMGMSGSTVDITDLAGTGFATGATVELIKTGEPNITATDVVVVSETQITCTFSLAGAAVGKWDVKVTNPDEQLAVLGDGFNVTAWGQFLTEDFESPFVNGAPPGWTKAYKTSTVDWTRNVGDYDSGDSAHGGNYNAMLFYSSASDHETYLITPVIDFGTGITDANLEFWHKQDRWPPDQDTLKVYYKTSAGGSWIQLASYTTDVSDWTKRTISLPNPGSTYYVGFLGNAKYGWGVCIDDVKVTGIIAPPVFTLTISSTVGGYTEPNEGTHQYSPATVVDINAIPEPNYHFVNWTGTAVTAGKVGDPNSADTTVTMDADYSLQANFALVQYTITATSGANGYIDPNGAIVKDYNSSQLFNAVADTGYEVDQWYLDGNSVQVGGTTYTLTNITEAHTVNVSFKLLIYTITASAGPNGSIDPEGTILVDYYSTLCFSAVPDIGYEVDEWFLDGNSVQTVGSAYCLEDINDDHTVSVTFKILTYTITATSGANGTIDPNGTIIKDYGSDQMFVAIPDVSYDIDEWFVDGNSVQVGGTTYTLIDIITDHAVYVTFKMITFAVSGYVVEPDGNTVVEGVLISTDTNDVNSVTDSNGYYELLVDYGWSGTVTPEKQGYVFEPNSDVYTNVTQDYNDANYTATLETFKISGYVLEEDYVTPISDVDVSAENGGGPWTSKYGGGSDVTDVNGYYEVVVDYNWSGEVVPAKYAYVFEPNRIEYVNVKSDSNDQDYTGALLIFTISGYIKNSCNAPIAGVLVDANNGGGQDTTDVNGFYEVWVDYNWSGGVTPTKNNYTFDPNWMSYVNVLADQTGQNYVAQSIYDLDCDGSIGFGDIGVIGDNWLMVGEDIPGDIYKDEDDIVNLLDFSIFAKVWKED